MHFIRIYVLQTTKYIEYGEWYCWIPITWLYLIASDQWLYNVKVNSIDVNNNTGQTNIAYSL